MAKDRSRNQKGAQKHAEGGHGRKTHGKIQSDIKAGGRGETKARADRQDLSTPPKNRGERLTNREAQTDHDDAGEHRLFEERQQHDDAEKKSEKTRLSRDVERHEHDREAFQIPGGAETHPRSGAKTPKDRAR